MQVQLVLLVILIIAIADFLIGTFIPRGANSEDVYRGFTGYSGIPAYDVLSQLSAHASATHFKALRSLGYVYIYTRSCAFTFIIIMTDTHLDVPTAPPSVGLVPRPSLFFTVATLKSWEDLRTRIIIMLNQYVTFNFSRVHCM